MTTATARIHRTIQSYRQRLLNREKQAVQALERYHQYTIANYIQPRLSKLYDQILKEQETLEEGETISRFWITERIRLEGLQLLISGQIDNFGALALQQTRMLQHTGVSLGLESAQQQLHDVVPAQARTVFGVPSTKALESLVGATQAGSPLADLFAGFGQEAADKAIKALVSGVTNGDNPRTIAPHVQQALGVSRNRALTISRTEANRCYRSASLETYRANDDVVGGWIWSADLSPRTCAACIAMNGTKHSLDEEFGSHPCCRCAPVPETRSFADILGPLGIDTSDLEDTSIAIQSGPDWFDEQSEEVKQQILGAAKYAAYNEGKFSLGDIVGTSHSDDWGDSVYEKSLKELVKK